MRGVKIMGLYEGIKDVAGIVQKADNIELYKQLLDLGSQALDMQNEIMQLRNENKELKDELNQKKRVIRHKNALYITLEGDEDQIHYCSTCWGSKGKLIQLNDEDRCYICDREWIAARH